MISLTMDTTFKHIIKEPKGKEWFDRIIKELVGIDLSKYEFYSEAYTSGEKEVRDFYSDIILKNEDIVIIEMQNEKEGSDKNYWYLFRIAGYNVERGKKYSKGTTLITFSNYYPNEEIKKKKGKVIELRMQNVEYKYEIENIRAYEIILPNYEKEEYTKDIERRMKLFNAKSYEEMEENIVDDLDRWVVEYLKILEGNKKFMICYDKELHDRIMKNTVYDDGLKDGRKEGIQEGIEINTIEMIKSLYKNGATLELISQSTNKSIEEVKNILNI